MCRSCRLGVLPTAQFRNGLELSISGLVISSLDDKVIRWSLNSLAQIGTRTVCARNLEVALQRNEANPEIVAAAVAALSKIYNGALENVGILANVQPEIKVLAALQNTDPSKLDLSGFKINIDTADAEILKLALITVGLNRDIENLFHPKHTNGEIIRALGQYDDPVVRQYCVWSVIENIKLSLIDLGIPFSDLDNQPDNVQSKLLQLAAERLPADAKKHEILERGSFLPSLIAREGLGKGLLKCHYDGLEDLVINWYDTEREDRVRLLLAEHMARYSDSSIPYEEKALEIAEEGGEFQRRILMGAEGQKLYRRVKMSSMAEGMGDLFEGIHDPVFQALNEVATNQHVRKNMKSLVLSASPVDEIPLRLDKEAADLKEKLALVQSPAIKVDIVHEWAVRVDQIQDHILNGKPEILHFSGHGDRGVLCFEDHSGSTRDVRGEDFADLVRLSPEVKCVVLNCCYSDSVASLVAPFVDAVIGCDASVSDDAAIVFSRSFYRALSHGKNYPEAFELAKNDIKLAGMDKDADLYKISTD